MTPEAFTAEYLRREADGDAKPQGADRRAILEEIAAEHGISYETARAWVLDNTFMGPC